MSTLTTHSFAGPVALGVGNPSGLTPLDLAIARMLGHEARDPLPRAVRDVSLNETLDNILEPALVSGPCLVSFSGGRESAWLLAAATAAARSRGHPDPIPATLRYPFASSGREAAHQERVIGYLGLKEWERVEIRDELETIGPYARRALTEVGVLFPATAYVFLPLLDLARGGWLVAGGALNDFFTYWRWARLSALWSGRRRPRRRDVKELSLAALPRPARRALLRSRNSWKPAPPWLREDAAREVERLTLAEVSDVPLRFDAATARQRTHRCYAGMRRSLDALAASAGARLLMPFRNDRYIAALGSAGGRFGFGDRMSTVRHLAGHLLPDELLRRSEGADDRHVFFGEPSRRFAASWSGGGADLEVVDTDALRESWSGDVLPWASTMLFHLAFMHDEALTGARG